MAIVENDATRLKVTDHDHDSLMVHNVESDGSVVITCHDADDEAYASCHLSIEERLALIDRLAIDEKRAREKRIADHIRDYGPDPT